MNIDAISNDDDRCTRNWNPERLVEDKESRGKFTQRSNRVLVDVVVMRARGHVEAYGRAREREGENHLQRVVHSNHFSTIARPLSVKWVIWAIAKFPN